ncbi:hypothetical protein KC19_8G070400 [Ceratodon purpureus]|uniref:Uncharacterized protein n=1 Tax=Ceratodon purpureus TaxID=3225 RepID=A0A8T0GY23_CERPU|nr:hypothetical protein KC19_8G070400 [Ceratodon purpureus]
MCATEAVVAILKRKARDPNMPRNPTRSMLGKIHFPFKKQEKEPPGSRAGSRPGSRPESR